VLRKCLFKIDDETKMCFKHCVKIRIDVTIWMETVMEWTIGVISKKSVVGGFFFLKIIFKIFSKRKLEMG
jgi:hypothetical protein